MAARWRRGWWFGGLAAILERGREARAKLRVRVRMNDEGRRGGWVREEELKIIFLIYSSKGIAMLEVLGLFLGFGKNIMNKFLFSY